MSYKFLTMERDGQNLIASKFYFFQLFQSIALWCLSQIVSSFTFPLSACRVHLKKVMTLFTNNTSPIHLEETKLQSIILHPIKNSLFFVVFLITVAKEQAVKD